MPFPHLRRREGSPARHAAHETRLLKSANFSAVKANRLLLFFLFTSSLAEKTRPRARGDSINTGVTAILAHDGNLFRQKVPAAIVVGNGFGKLAGSTQVNELGELESPIVLTCTLCVPRAADAVLTWLLNLPGNEDVRSANPVVAETNDGYLNDIRARPITEADVLSAINGAAAGPVAEGAVGAGRGTVAFGWKGGIGTSSRKLPAQSGGWAVGVLVQTNYGGDLLLAGVPVGRELRDTGHGTRGSGDDQ